MMLLTLLGSMFAKNYKFSVERREKVKPLVT